jgi:hypothetical protein
MRNGRSLILIYVLCMHVNSFETYYVHSFTYPRNISDRKMILKKYA